MYTKLQLKMTNCVNVNIKVHILCDLYRTWEIQSYSLFLRLVLALLHVNTSASFSYYLH